MAGEFLPPDSSRPTPCEPLVFLHPAEVAEVENATGLVLRIHEGWHVFVSRQGWAADQFAVIEADLWLWLATVERRAAFALFAVLVPNAGYPAAKVTAYASHWEDS